VLTFPPFRLDPADERLWRDGQEVRLRRKPFAILRYLAENPGRLVTQDELVGAVWGKVAMSESLLRTHVHALRNAIGAGIVETVVGRGYRFVAKVSAGDDSAPVSEPRTAAQILVERDDALEVLRAAWRDVLGGKRRMIFVVGEPGIGKTAVVDAFLREVARERTGWIARGVCVEQYGSGEAYLPVRDAIGTFARSSDGSQLIEVLARCAPAWLAQTPALVPNDGIAALQSGSHPLPETSTLLEIAQAFDVWSHKKPVVLLLEDLHWADHSTVELLALLGQRHEAAPILVLCTCRDTQMTRADPLMRVISELQVHDRATVIRLEGLSESAVAEYLALRFAPHSFPADFAARIRVSTGGNPLFTIGLLGELEHHGVLKAAYDRWQLTIPPADVGAHHPDTVIRLIDNQIDRLTADEQRVLEAASVAGAVFNSAVVAFALDLEPDRADAICELLANECRFLSVMGTETWPDGTIQYRYAFTHAMIQYAALSRSPSARNRLLHCRIGECLEQAYGPDSESIAAELASHFDEGHQFLKAVQYYVTAGERAVRGLGSSSARRQFERARDTLSRLPPGQARDALDLRILRNLVASHRRDQTERSQSELPDESVRNAEQARDDARRLNDPVLRAESTVVSAHLAMNAGELVRAAAVLDELLSAFEGPQPARTDSLDDPTISAQWTRGIISWLLGYPDDSLVRVQRAVARARSTAERYPIWASVSVLANIQMLRRDAAGTLETVRGMPPLEQSEIRGDLEAIMSVMTGWAKVVLDPTECRSVADELSTPPTRFKVIHTFPVIEVCKLAGRIERGLQHVSECFAEVEKTGERVLLPEILRLRGELLRSTARAEAEQSLEEAIELARTQSSRSFELRATMSLCRLQRGKSRKKTLEDLRRQYQWFTEGLETRDLRDAKALLES
jgi:DNA-binding winged helix-turn-helix (wHTH) protein